MSIHVKDFGVFPDEAKVQTKELQAAIDRCAEMGGGEILFDAGVYRTGTLWLRSNTYLHLPYGCRIKGSDDYVLCPIFLTSTAFADTNVIFSYEL